MIIEALTSYAHQAWVWSTSSALHSVIAGVVLLIALVLVQEARRPAMAGIPGPFLARYTDLWLTRQAMRGNRSEVVHGLHKKYGRFVRIAPNHVSIADHAALNPVYGHGTGSLKADFYDAFAAPTLPRGLFNTRSRPEHSRKRKIVSHTFAPKSIAAFEPFVRMQIQILVGRLEELSKSSQDGWYALDVLMWMNYFAFDTIGSLAFGSTFGMLERGSPEADVELPTPSGKMEKTTCNAVQIINERGDYSATLGVVPPYLRPYAAKLPWFSNRLKSVKKLTGIAFAKVNQRLEHGSDREDLLAKLQAGTDETGQTMGKYELVAESLTQLIAGSDTTSNSATAIIYHLCQHPAVMKKLRQELDASLPDDSDEVPLLSDVDSLPYLNAVINESLRIHSTSAIGLPRLMPQGGVTIDGKHFPEGSVLSVPTYTIHRDPTVWGKDAEEYRPERWLDAEGKATSKSDLEKSFNPFSTGPRVCVGRNLAIPEQQMLIATLVKRFDFKLEKPEDDLLVVEGFLRKPVTLPAKVRIRRKGEESVWS